MASITDLGNGIGLIYATDPTTTTDIKFNIPNDAQGARSAKLLGVQSSNIASNLVAVGTITIDTVTGTGNITKVGVNTITQISANVPFTIATSTSDLAALIAEAVNANVPASGYNYSSIAVNNIVYLLAPASVGDLANGLAVEIVISANATASVTNMDGGSNANSYAYDNQSGYRFFLDSSDSAAEGTIGVNATEITNFICQRGLETGIPILTPTIASGVLTIERQASIQYVIINGEGSASDTLTTINPVNFANGDQIICLGVSGAIVITIDNTGNIVTQGGTSFVTGDYSNMITLSKSGTSWYEVSKSTTGVPTAAQFRTANFPLLSTSGYGSAALTAADNTTVTLTANTSKQKQVVTGTVSLTTGNYTIAVSTTDAKAGDTFDIEYNGVVTVGSYAVIIGGVTLSAADALSGGIVVRAYYSGSAWQYECFKDFNQAAKVQTADIATSAVTVAKLEANLQYEVVTIPVSFETGEQAMNKFKMPYAGTVSEIYAIATKAIAATDAGTIVLKDNAGTTATAGTITFAASDAINTAYTVSPSAGNTFVAGDILQLLTAKTTAGGKALVSLKITRS